MPGACMVELFGESLMHIVHECCDGRQIRVIRSAL